MSRLGAPLALMLLVACRPAPDEEPLPCRNDEPGEALLGAGDLGTGFLELEDELLVAFGPQGMHMVILSLRVWDMEEPAAGGFGSEVRIAMLDDGEVFGGTLATLTPSVEEVEYVEFLGLRAVITAAEVEGVTGRPIELVGTVIDGCGRELSSSHELTLTE